MKMFRRSICVLLAVVLLVGMIPAATLSVSAQSNTYVTNFSELKAALESREDSYIVVNSFTPSTYGYDYEIMRSGTHYEAGKAAINIPAGVEKQLYLNCDLDFRAVDTAASKKLFSFIRNEGVLSINGPGALKVSFNSTDCPNAIVYQADGKGALYCYGAILDATQNSSFTYGYAIHNAGAELEIKGGTYIGDSKKSGHTPVAAVYSDASKKEYGAGCFIYSGTFKASSADGTPTYGIYAISNPNNYYTAAFLEGGTFYGMCIVDGYIGDSLSNSKHDPHHYTRNGEDFNPGALKETTDTLEVVRGEPEGFTMPAYVDDFPRLKEAMESSYVDTVIVANNIKTGMYNPISFPDYASGEAEDTYKSLINVWGNKKFINDFEIELGINRCFMPTEDSVFDINVFYGVFRVDEDDCLTMDGEGSFLIAAMETRHYMDSYTNSISCLPCVVYLNGGTFELLGGTIGAEPDYVRYYREQSLSYYKYAYALAISRSGGNAYLEGGTLQGAACGRERYQIGMADSSSGGLEPVYDAYTSNVISIHEDIDFENCMVYMNGCELKSIYLNDKESSLYNEITPLQMGWVGPYGRIATEDHKYEGYAYWDACVIDEAKFSTDVSDGFTLLGGISVSQDLLSPMESKLPWDRYSSRASNNLSTVVKIDENFLEFEKLFPTPTEEEREAETKNLGKVTLGTSEMNIGFGFDVADIPKSMRDEGYSTSFSMAVYREFSLVSSFNYERTIIFADYAKTAGQYSVVINAQLKYDGEVFATKTFTYNVEVVSPITVNEISAGLSSPSVGGTGGSATCSQAGVTISATKWQVQRNGRYEDMGPSDTFVENNSYRAIITATANGGYYFADGVTAMVGGVAADGYSSRSSKTVVFYRNYTAEKPYINILINAPLPTQTVANNNLSGSIMIDTNCTRARVMSAKWTDQNGNNFTGTFAAGGKYTVKVQIKPIVGRFDAETVFKVNNNTASRVTIHPVDRYAVVEYDFRLGTSYIAITNLAEPVVYTETKAPTFNKTVSDNNNNLSISAVWLDGAGNEFTGTFSPGQKYTVKISIAATGGGTVGRYAVIINGKNPVKIENTASNVKAAYYDFYLSSDIVYFTDDSKNAVGKTMTVDIEKTAEQNDKIMEVYFNGEISYQWLKNGTAIGGATGESRKFTEADVGNTYQVKVIYGASYVISAPFEITQNSSSLSLGGTVSSEGSASDAVTVELLSGNSVLERLTLYGNSVKYAFRGIEAGSYTLRITKSGHRPYSASVNLVDKNVTRDVTLSLLGDVLLGDVDLNGKVNSADSNLLKRMIAGSYYVEVGSDSFKAGDIDGDGKLNSVDSNTLKRIIAGAI